MMTPIGTCSVCGREATVARRRASFCAYCYRGHVVDRLLLLVVVVFVAAGGWLFIRLVSATAAGIP